MFGVQKLRTLLAVVNLHFVKDLVHLCSTHKVSIEREEIFKGELARIYCVILKYITEECFSIQRKMIRDGQTK